MSGLAASIKAMAMRRLLKRRIDLLAEKRLRYAAITGRAEIEAFQTARLNEIWAFCLREVPFYQQWAAEHRLPSEIRHIRDVAGFPVLTKDAILARQDLVFRNLSRKDSVGTGGTTGEPTRFPATLACMEPGWANAYLGRGWWGIEPFDPIAHVWGHAHLFGTGWRGRVAHVKRLARDWLLNSVRLSAYDMSPAAVARYARRIEDIDPVAIIGYTSAIFRLARHVSESAGAWPGKRLKGLVITSETVSPADIAVIEEAFGAPAILEYGSAETGVIAYSHPATRKLHLFWDTLLALADKDGDIRITTINPRVFPLINYGLGDVVATADPPGTSILTLDSVQGRTQDAVTVATGGGSISTVSGLMLVHILKQYPGIRSVAFEQLGESRFGVFMEAQRPLDLRHASEFLASEMKKLDFPDFDASNVAFFQVEEQQRTTSGKHRLIRVPEERGPMERGRP